MIKKKFISAMTSELSDQVKNETDGKMKKMIVKEVAYPGNPYLDPETPASPYWEKTREAIIDIINTDDEYAEYRQYVDQSENNDFYEAIVLLYLGEEYYGDEDIDLTTFGPLIDNAIQTVLASIAAYDSAADPSGENKPAGYDTMNDYLETLIDDYILDDSEEGKNQDIVDMIESIKSEYMDADTIIGYLEGHKPYTDFMGAFKDGKKEFAVNKDNVYFARAVGEAIDGFAFDKILSILKGKGWGALIDILGEDIVEEIFDASTDAYSDGLLAVVKDIEDGKVESDTYTTSISVSVNAPTILKGMYDKYAEKFEKKIAGNGIYEYAKNESLQKLVGTDWFAMAVGYDASKVNGKTGNTGYYFKDFTSYYEAMLDTIILYDNAMCYYNKCTDDEMKEVKKSLTKEFREFLQNISSLSDKIAAGQPIVGSYTLNDLIAKADALKNVTDSLGTSLPTERLKPIIDNVKGILTGLGHGDLPLGYTLSDLEVLSEKLENAVNAMNESEYETANASFTSFISTAMDKFSEIIEELDTNGTIAGRPIDSIMEKIGFVNRIYTQYKARFEAIISALADAGLGSFDIEADTEKMEDAIFGREVDDVYNVDSVVDTLKKKLTSTGKTGYDASGRYIIDQYSKTINGKDAVLERNFY